MLLDVNLATKKTSSSKTGTKANKKELYKLTIK